MNDINQRRNNLKKQLEQARGKVIDSELIRQKLAQLDRLAEEHPRLLGSSTLEEWEDTLKEALMRKEVYTVKEAADLLHCHENTIRREIKRGKLKASKIGRDWRISRADLQSYWKSLGGNQLFVEDSEE